MEEEGTGKSQLIELSWLPDREGIERKVGENEDLTEYGVRCLKELEVGIKVGMLDLEIKIKIIKGEKILWNIIGVFLEFRISHSEKSK